MKRNLVAVTIVLFFAIGFGAPAFAGDVLDRAQDRREDRRDEIDDALE